MTESFYNLRRHSFDIRPLHCASTNSCNNFFTYRVLKIWNKLTENIICAPDLMLFRCHLKKFDLGSIVALEFH